MAYTTAQTLSLKQQCATACEDLLRLHVRFDQAATDIPDDRGKEHIKYGVGRRLHLIGFALRNIYRIFPPDRATTLGLQELADVQLNLHAFVINLSGSFDNMAWAFVLRHSLLNQVGGPINVGMFRDATQRLFPFALKTLLDAPEAKTWQRTYMKDYRDALAHRIPLYLPPAVVTKEEADRYGVIEQEKLDALRKRQFDRIEKLEEEQAQLGRPCFAFMHSFDPGSPSRPIALHLQLVTDTRTLIGFGEAFLQHWHAHE